MRSMQPIDDAERRRLLIARAEYHERLAAQIRRLVDLVCDDPPREPPNPPPKRPPTLLR